MRRVWCASLSVQSLQSVWCHRQCEDESLGWMLMADWANRRRGRLEETQNTPKWPVAGAGAVIFADHLVLDKDSVIGFLARSHAHSVALILQCPIQVHTCATLSGDPPRRHREAQPRCQTTASPVLDVYHSRPSFHFLPPPFPPPGDPGLQSISQVLLGSWSVNPTLNQMCSGPELSEPSEFQLSLSCG